MKANESKATASEEKPESASEEEKGLRGETDVALFLSDG